MRAAGLIARKDLTLRIRDRSAFVIGIIAPLGLAFIFNLILGDIDTGAFTPSYSVTDLDNGQLSVAFVGVLDQLDADGVIEIVERPSTVEEARALAEGDTVSAAIVIPEGFSQAALASTDASVLIIANPDNPVQVEIARSMAAGFASEVRTSQLAVATAAAGASPPLSQEEVGRLVAAASEGLPEAIVVGGVQTNSKELDLATFFAAGMSVFFLFFTVSFGVNGLLEEQQQGTIRRLVAAPIKSTQIVMGKAIVSFILGIVSMTLLIVASSYLLGASWGDPIGVGLLVVAGVVSATGLMMVVAAFAKTPEQAGNLQAILAIGLGMLGGIFFPGALGTGFLSYVSYISPHRWFLVGLGDLASGDGVSVIVPSLLGLVSFGVIAWAAAMARFRTKDLIV
ncbi:MAG: ABC transporter permease [Acidimicrobiia bacterium]